MVGAKLGTANPTPLIVTVSTSHVVATSVFFDTGSAFRALPYMTTFRPFMILFVNVMVAIPSVVGKCTPEASRRLTCGTNEPSVAPFSNNGSVTTRNGTPTTVRIRRHLVIAFEAFVLLDERFIVANDFHKFVFFDDTLA